MMVSDTLCPLKGRTKVSNGQGITAPVGCWLLVLLSSLGNPEKGYGKPWSVKGGP